MLVDPLDEAKRLKVGYDSLPRNIAIETVIGRVRQINGGVWVKDIDRMHLMAQTDFMVVEIMRGRDFQTAGAEFRINVIIGNDRD